MTELKSHVWVFPYSVSNHCCFSSSFIVFHEAVTQEQATVMIKSHDTYRNAFETLDMSPEEEQSLLQAMRAQT